MYCVANSCLFSSTYIWKSLSAISVFNRLWSVAILLYVSIAVDSKLYHNLTLDEFKIKLLEELKPKADVFYDADEEGDEDE